MILEFSCPGGAREPISPTQLKGTAQVKMVLRIHQLG